jgi:hypothetical protein
MKVCNSVMFSLTIPNDSFDDSPLSKEVYMEGGEEGPHVAVPNLPFLLKVAC